MTAKRIILALMLIATGAAARAAESGKEPSYWDFSVKTGVTVGTLKQGELIVANQEAEELDVPYGGLPLALVLNQDLSRGLTLGVELHFVIDMSNTQLTEKGLHLSLATHLLGGSRRTVTDYPYGQIVHSDPMNVSFVTRLAFSSYSVSNKDGDQKVEGGAFEVMFGLQYRQDIGEKSAVSFDVGKVLLSFPASSPRVTTDRLEFGVSYRFFL